jgi:YD repeat-containing protein
MTLQNAAQVNPIDVIGYYGASSAHTSMTAATTTTVANDLLLSFADNGTTGTFTTFGAGETETFKSGVCSNLPCAGSWKSAASSTGSESMTSNSNSTTFGDQTIIAVKPAIKTTLSSTVYRAKVDDGSFNSYTWANNAWTVYDKKGNRYLYGSDDTGRMYDTNASSSGETYRWYLQEMRDTNGNYIKYSYLRDNNVLYPYKITYTGNGTTDGISTLTFATSTRPDTRISFAGAFAATTTQRISEIDASVNNSVVRKYLLGYGTGHNGYRSLLTSVKEQGYDDNGNLTSLPATTFTYSTSSAMFYAPGSATIQSPGFVVTDVQGDGTNDTSVFTSQYSHIFINNNAASTSVSGPDYWAVKNGAGVEEPSDRGVRFIDINGDGKADVIKGYRNDYTGVMDQSIYLNSYSATTSTYGWNATSTWNGMIPPITVHLNDNVTTLTGGIFGLPDYEESIPGYAYPAAYFGNGQAWDENEDIYTPIKDFPVSGPNAYDSQLVDINGDGLDDWVYSDGTNIYVALNTGNGWQTSPEPQWTIATSSLYHTGSDYYDRGIRFMDLNGDGLPDFVRSYQIIAGGGCGTEEVADVKVVYLNTGNGWATSTAYSLPAYITYCDPVKGFVNNEYANFNGNGQQKQDLLTSVNYSKGGSINVAYTSSTSTNPQLPVALQVVSSIATNDGLGNIATTTYSYAGGQLFTAWGPRERKFAGFASSTITAPDSITTSYFNQGDGVNATIGEQSDGYSQISHAFRTDIFDLSNNIKQRTYLKWDAYAHGDSTFVGLGRQMVETFAADGSHRDRDTEYQYSSTTDDLIKSIDYGEVVGNSDGTFSDITGDTRTTTMSYVASSSVNMSLPSEKAGFDNNSATSSDEKLYYDSLAFGQVGVGDNTKQQDWVSGTKYASSTKTYTSYGSVATSTDRNGNATSYVYDSYNLYPATTTNPLLQRTQSYFNYSNGKVKQSTDPNNRLTLNLYDGIGRLTETSQSSTSTPTTYATTTKYVYTDSTSTSSSVQRTDYLAPSKTIDTFDYYDGLNRLIQERKISQTTNVYATVDRVYNGAGLLASSSLPYLSTGSSRTSSTATSALYSNYTYDALKRPLSISNAVATTNNTYSKWTKTTTDPNSHIKDYIFDAFGNLANVVEHLDSANATTTYTYDTLNNLSTTTDSLGNVRHFTYDGLSSRLTAQDLHTATSSSYGTWNYTYDDQGNLTSQTDPKNQTVNRAYDALNRILTEDYTGQAGTEVTNTYDSCTNGIGQLCTASSTAAKTSNAYDILGRVTSATTTVNNTAYNIRYQYDRQGNITGLTYPDSSQVTYSFNLGGLPSKIQRKPSGGSLSDIVSNFDTSPTVRFKMCYLATTPQLRISMMQATSTVSPICKPIPMESVFKSSHTRMITLATSRK